MSTTSRKDFDRELAAWLDMVHAEQSVEGLDQLADLYVKTHEAVAIKDKNSPAAEDKHAEINGILTAMGL